VFINLFQQFLLFINPRAQRAVD